MSLWIRLVVSIALPYILQRLAEEKTKATPDEKQKLEEAIEIIKKTMERQCGR